MEEGLAHKSVYGSGEFQNVKHKYSGSIPNKKRKKCKKLHKNRKKL